MGVKIWYDGELIQEIDAQDVRHIVAEGNMYVVLPEGYQCQGDRSATSA